MKTCFRHQNSKASSPQEKNFSSHSIDPNRSQFYAWFHLFGSMKSNMHIPKSGSRNSFLGKEAFEFWCLKHAFICLWNILGLGLTIQLYLRNLCLLQLFTLLSAKFYPNPYGHLDQSSFLTINANWRPKSSPWTSRFCLSVPVPEVLELDLKGTHINCNPSCSTHVALIYPYCAVGLTDLFFVVLWQGPGGA